MTFILKLLLPMTFVWKRAFCIHVVILHFVIIQMTQDKVFLHHGTYSLDMVEGMVYSTSTEKCTRSPLPYSPCRAAQVCLCAQQGCPACCPSSCTSLAIGPSSAHSPPAGCGNSGREQPRGWARTGSRMETTCK